jgi:hypothetical protein
MPEIILGIRKKIIAARIKNGNTINPIIIILF